MCKCTAPRSLATTRSRIMRINMYLNNAAAAKKNSVQNNNMYKETREREKTKGKTPTPRICDKLTRATVTENPTDCIRVTSKRRHPHIMIIDYFVCSSK